MILHAYFIRRIAYMYSPTLNRYAVHNSSFFHE